MKLEIVFKNGERRTINNVVMFHVTEEQKEQKERPVLTVGKRFKIDPMEIDQSIFERLRRNDYQEWMRQIIQEAFAELDKEPKKYDRVFYTLIPEAKWDWPVMNGKRLDEYAKKMGGQMANWIEQALEWAQRIYNGESWEEVCNKCVGDYNYVVKWKRGMRIVGTPITACLCDDVYDRDQTLGQVVPLLVFEEE